ncbi:MAG TPA: hypothetical protein V6D04_10255 [Candidatus Obscuribacterales bacterium]
MDALIAFSVTLAIVGFLFCLFSMLFNLSDYFLSKDDYEVYKDLDKFEELAAKHKREANESLTNARLSALGMVLSPFAIVGIPIAVVVGLVYGIYHLVKTLVTGEITA